MRREVCRSEDQGVSTASDPFSHFALLSSISHQLLRHRDQDALDAILQLLLEQFHSEFGILGYIDTEGRLACPTLTRHVWSRCGMPDKRIVFELSELGGVLGEVLHSRRTVISNTPRPVPVGHVPIHNFLGAPMVSEGALIGCIFLANSAREYDEQEARLLTQIGIYLAPIVEAWRGRLDEEQRRERAELELQKSVSRLRRSMKRLQVLAAIGNLADGSIDEDSLARIVLQMLEDAVKDLPHSAIRLILRGRLHQPHDFEETPNKISAGIFVDSSYAGAIELCINPADMPEEDLHQERLFLTEAAERLGSMLSRRRAAEEIAATRRHLEVLLETTRIGLSVIDENGTVRYVDPWQKKVHGDFQGVSVEDYFLARKVQDADWIHNVLEALRDRKKTAFEHRLPGADDAVAQTTVIPYQDPTGDSWCAATITVDVTEQKRLESALNHARRMESVGRLAAGVAHELNTPIQYIGDNLSYLAEAFHHVLGLVEAMHQAAAALEPSEADNHARLLQAFDWEYHRDEVPKALEESRRGVEQVAHIVRAMKVFSHQGGREKQDVDLHRMLQAAIDISRNEWKNVATIQTEFDPTLQIVPLHAAEFNMAVVNLIVNAAQAIAERPDLPSRPGIIIVRTKALDDAWVEIQVEDNGPGIPQEIQDRVFDAFFTTKEVGKGTGQGLTTAHHTIVDLHGGTLQFRSKPGEGTVFFIRIPRSRTGGKTGCENSTSVPPASATETATPSAVAVCG